MKSYTVTGEQMKFGEYITDKPLTLVPYPNGGWAIEQQEDIMRLPPRIGAYSNANDLLQALAFMLMPQPESEPEARK